MSFGNILDHAIGYFSPGSGLRRVRQRVAMDIVTRSYGGADSGRLKSGKRAKSTSADAEIGRAGRVLRDRMRELVRNNPHAANAVSQLVSHAIGDGIMPRSKDKNVNTLFARWSKQCDADGHHDFYGLQALVVREMFESGNGIVRRRRRRLEDGLAVPLQLQVLEADLIDNTKEGVLSGGGRAIQGIEFDALGRRRAFWMFGAHPGNSFFEPQLSLQSKPVPSTDIAHVFEKQRTQVLGVPWGTPAMDDMADLAGYDKAEQVRKRLEACLVGTLVGGDDADGLGMPVTGEDGKSLPPGIYDVHGARVEKFEPGMFYNAVGGREVRFSQPAATGGYDPYKTSKLHDIAAGWRMPYSIFTGRLDKVNYSSSKIGLEGFKRLISALQWQVIIPMLLQPIWEWFCEAAYIAGLIPSPDVPVEWSPPRFYSADPARDLKARVGEARAGFRSLTSAIAEGGENAEDVFREWAEDIKLLDKYGLVFDTDPRRMSQAGQRQQDPEEPPDKDEDEKDNPDDN